MNRRFSILAICLAIATSAAAQEPLSSQAPVERYRIKKSRSSEMNREDKTYYLSGQPMGFAVAPIPSAGVNAGYYLNPDLLLQLEVTSGEARIYAIDVAARTAAINAKYFVGNSFYAKGGAAYRQIALKNAKCSNCTAAQKEALADLGAADTLMAEFAIGNQWQWDSFTLGCDWIGMMVPLARLKVDNRYADKKGLTAQERSELDDSWNALASVQSFQVLRFYLGASF